MLVSVGVSGRLAPFGLVSLAMAVISDAAIAQDINDEAASVRPLDTIIVTARRIEEPVRDVPFAISAVTGEAIEERGIYETADLFRSIPNFNYTDSGLSEANLLNVRGIGSSSTFLSPSVTYYIDGVPVPQRAFDQQFLDIERIEVLRGPQGTLFGQNAQAGAVSIVTADAGEVPEISAHAEYGNFDALRLGGVVSAPLSNKIAARVSARFFDRDGDVRNFLFAGPNVLSIDETIRERRNISVSGKVNYTSNAGDTALSLSGRFQSDRQHPTTGLLLGDFDFPRNALDPRPLNKVESGGGALTIRHNFDDARLTAITGYERYDLSLNADITDGFIASAGSGAPPFIFAPVNAIRRIDEDLSQWSQELRLDGMIGSELTWVAGLSALYADFVSATDIMSPFLPNGNYAADLEKINVAVFGEVTIPVAQDLRLVTGVRLTHEETDFDGRFSGRTGGAPATPFFSESGSTEHNFVTGRVSLSYDVGTNTVAHVSVARGAKAGGFPFFNQSAAFGIPLTSFEQSSTRSFEAGLKGQLFDSRFSYASSVFFNDTDDEQLFIFNPLVGQFQVENADTESYGLELEVTVQATDHLVLSGNLALLETKATEDNGGSVREGNKTPYAPELSAGVRVEYTVPGERLGVAGDMILWGQYSRVGERQIDPANSTALAAYDIADFRVTYRADQFELYVFANNAFDGAFAQSGFAAGVSPSGTRVFGGVPGQPRLFGGGVRVTY